MRVGVCLLVDAAQDTFHLPPEAGFVTRSLPAADDVPSGSTHLLVVGTAAQEARTRSAASVLGVACGLPAAWRALPVGPSAVAHTTLAALAEGDHPARVLSRLDALSANAFAAAWVPSVSGLESPSPSLRQHLRSWLPGGAGFLVVHTPEPTVLSVPGTLPAPGDAQRGPLMVCGTGAPSAAVRMAGTLAGSSGDVEAPAAAPAGRYGRAAAVELLALTPLPPHRDGDAHGRPCGVCALEVAADACPYCRVAVPRPLEGASS